MGAPPAARGCVPVLGRGIITPHPLELGSPCSAPGPGSPEAQLCPACSESSPGALSPLQCLSFSLVTAGGAQPCCLTAATCPVTYAYYGMPEIWDNQASPHKRDSLLRAGNGIYQLSQGQRGREAWAGRSCKRSR